MDVAMTTSVTLSPFRCRMWADHDRLDEYITEQSCKSEIESIAANGQRIPVLGRPVKDDPMYDVELIYGARRLFVARHLNIPLLVQVREMTDQEAAVALDIENRKRKDVSPYERGLCYSRWLRAKYFNSQEEIARVLGISASQVSRTLKLAQLPAVIVQAFANPLEIAEKWGLDLHRAWQDEQRQHAMIAAARSLAQKAPRLSAEEVYQRLMTQAVSGGRGRVKMRDEVVKDETGRPLFRVRYFRKSVAIVMDTERMPRRSLDRVKVAVSQTLQHAIAQVPGFAEQSTARTGAQRTALVSLNA
jgi:ParB family transcriptional regulator, chromosome partitioning protein